MKFEQEGMQHGKPLRPIAPFCLPFCRVCRFKASRIMPKLDGARRLIGMYCTGLRVLPLHTGHGAFSPNPWLICTVPEASRAVQSGNGGC